MKVDKLISEYNSKISDMDKVIESCYESIRQLRNKGLSINGFYDLKLEHMKDQSIAQAKRQNYVQFIVDLECLND